jgi:hypothetical protein
VSITVKAVNDAPAAGDDSYSTDEDTALTIAAPACSATTPTSRAAALHAVLVSGPRTAR